MVFEGEGKHFSFGASVEEHLPGEVDKMLPSFHAMFGAIEDMGIATAAVVRGQCLGGGLELAAYCGRLLCTPKTFFGVPEVKLGVFPPVGAMILPWRIGGARANQMVLTGDTINGETAAAWGLADVCCEDPAAELDKWYDEHIAPKSAVALSFAWRAGRRAVRKALDEELPELEKSYLKDLMSMHDPAEGIRAFVERRDPKWRHE